MRQKLISLGWVALGAIASGTMLVLALPLGEQAWLAWFMLVPLLMATRERGFLVGFIGGLIAVFWCALLASSGLFYHYKTFEGGPAWTLTGCGLFGFSFAIFFAIWADRKNHEKSVFWFAALAVSLESILLLVLPAPLAIMQYRSPMMLALASLVGIWGVSFFVWLANIICVTRKLGWFAALAVAFASTMSMHSKPVEGEHGTTVAISQIADGMDEELVAAHHKISVQRPAFDVWPEFAGNMYVHGGDTGKLKDLSSESSPIITSFQDTAKPLPHNVAALFEDGNESVRYEKRKLFGKETTMHTPGKVPVAVPLKSGDIVGLNICFDSCFPFVIRETAALPEVKYIALPTIDPDSQHYFLAGMHAAFTPFRAAENGVAFIRADGHFGSMIVNNRGRIVAELHNEQTSLSGKVSTKRVWTLYRVIGDLFWHLCILITIAYPISTSLKNAKKYRQRVIEAAKDAL